MFRLIATLIGLIAVVPALHSQPLGSAFSYQGRLTGSGAPANGNYDFEVRLFDAQSAGSTIASTVALTSVPVSAGLFTVSLDFGAGAFSGQRRWLEIRVQPAGGGGYTTLSPRQELTAAPYALWSAKAGDAQSLGGVASSGYLLAGAILPVSQGGTGATDAATARGNLQAARSGANSDLTSLSGLTTPLAVTQGGTAAATAPAALAALNAQARVTGACPVGQYLRVVNADGTAVCGTDADTNSGGTLTSVATGAGLTGGPITTTGTVSIATGGVTSSMIANGAVGAAQINTSQVQARLATTCPGGQYLRGANPDGSVVCGTFDFSPTITTVDSAGGYTSIAVGTDGFPVVSYYGGGAVGTLKVAKCVNPACTGTSVITTVDGPSVGIYTSIAIGTDGFPVVSYYAGGALKVAKCVNAACTGTSTITAVDDPPNQVGSFTSIAIGTDGFPVIAYQDLTAQTLKVAKCVNAACTGTSTITTVDDPPNQVGWYISLAIGADGLPVVAYQDLTAQTLKVAKCLNAACTGTSTITTVDNPANNVGSFTSIAIGVDGFPVISYSDATALSLKVAKCVNVGCTGVSTISTVDAPIGQGVGAHTSITIATDGFPVISYWDFAHFALKVAKCANAACTGTSTATIVDNPGDEVGLYTSIVIGTDGLPVISYHKQTGVTALKVAKCNRPSCAP